VKAARYVAVKLPVGKPRVMCSKFAAQGAVPAVRPWRNSRCEGFPANIIASKVRKHHRIEGAGSELVGA
jgi:hypothetical protein